MKKRVLVIHPNPNAEDYQLLKVIYDGKGYDVIRDPEFSEDYLIREVTSHDMIVFIGCFVQPDSISAYNDLDGTYKQLFNNSHADLLRSKVTYSVCCGNSYFKENRIPGLHTDYLITVGFAANLCGIFDYDDEEVKALVRPLMASIRNNIEMEDYNQMRRVILQQYDADDPITKFNRLSIVVL